MKTIVLASYCDELHMQCYVHLQDFINCMQEKYSQCMMVRFNVIYSDFRV